MADDIARILEWLRGGPQVEAPMPPVDPRKVLPMPPVDPRKNIPMPRADPRMWADRLSRTQNLQYPALNAKDTIPPSLLLYGKGINPSPGHGDMMDYTEQELMTRRLNPKLWRQDI